MRTLMLTLAVAVALAAALLTPMSAAASTVHAEATAAPLADETRTIPETVWYQGFLADVDTGDPINGTSNIIAQLYSAESGGSSLWGPETHNSISIIEGWFNIELGATVSLPAFDAPPYYLQLTVDGEVFAPRLKLASAPTALRSSIAEQGDGDWAVSGINVYRMSGNVGIGDSTPDYKLDVEGSVGATTYYGDGSNLTGIAGTNDNDWTINGDNVYHLLGRVGIGTTSPENTFHITGAGAAAGGVPGWNEIVGRFRRNGGGHTGLSIDATLAADPILYLAENGRARWSMRSDASQDRNLEVRFHGTGGTIYPAVIDTTGRVGIGTRDPGARLSIDEGGGLSSLHALNTSTSVQRVVNIERTQTSSSGLDMLQIKMAAGSSDLAEFIEFERGSTVEARIKANGNVLTNGSVGIGSAGMVPDARLHVSVDGSDYVDPITVEVDGETTFNVSDTGGVGIGTTGHGTGLEVHNVDGYSNAAFTARHYGSWGSVGTFHGQSAPSSGDNVLYLQTTAGTTTNFQFIECVYGFMGDTEFKVNGNGNVYADGGYYGPADFAEMLAVSSGARSVEAGDVMVIDPTRDRSIAMSVKSHSTLVAGVYSTAPGFVGSPRDWDKPNGEGDPGTYSFDDMATMHDEIPLAVMGIVPCKVSAENGPIEPGALLVTSSTPGHAMRDDAPPVGTVIGKALGSLNSGTGVIDVLVTLQ